MSKKIPIPFLMYKDDHMLKWPVKTYFSLQNEEKLA